MAEQSAQEKPIEKVLSYLVNRAAREGAYYLYPENKVQLRDYLSQNQPLLAAFREEMRLEEQGADNVGPVARHALDAEIASWRHVSTETRQAVIAEDLKRVERMLDVLAPPSVEWNQDMPKSGKQVQVAVKEGEAQGELSAEDYYRALMAMHRNVTQEGSFVDLNTTAEMLGLLERAKEILDAEPLPEDIGDGRLAGKTAYSVLHQALHSQFQNIAAVFFIEGRPYSPDVKENKGSSLSDFSPSVLESVTEKLTGLAKEYGGETLHHAMLRERLRLEVFPAEGMVRQAVSLDELSDELQEQEKAFEVTKQWAARHQAEKSAPKKFTFNPN